MDKQNLKNRRVISFLSVGGIKAIINTRGVIRSNTVLHPSKKDKIEEYLKDGCQNILDDWVVSGEYKDNTFYVDYIKDNNGKILDIYDTKDWAGIMGFKMLPIIEKGKYEKVTDNGKIRAESSFDCNNFREMTTGSMRSSWRRKLIEGIK